MSSNLTASATNLKTAIIQELSDSEISQMLPSYYSPLVAALVTLVVIPFLVSSKIGWKLQDVPNERSLHQGLIPRVGGLGLMAGVCSAWLLMAEVSVWWIWLPVLLLFVFSMMDDMHGLPVHQRLLLHVIAAAMMVLGSGMTGQSVVVALVVLLSTVWMTNLFNFMDGADGLAGGMAVFGFSMYGIASLMHGDETLAILNFSISAAALAFLYFNFYPAKVFMGDAGSIPLGFLSAAMGVWGWQKEYWPLWFPLLVFSPFIVDATLTLVKRLLRGENIWQAHRSHYYQRLILMGWGHRRTAISQYGLMLAVALSAVWMICQPKTFQLIGLSVWCLVYAFLAVWVDRLWRAASSTA